MLIQNALPFIDLRPFCPVCKQHADELVQAYPITPRLRLCHGCYDRLNITMDAFEVSPAGEIRFKIPMDDQEVLSLWKAKERVQMVKHALQRLTAGCVLAIDDIPANLDLPCGNRPNCPKCRRDAQYSAGIRQQTVRHNRGLPPMTMAFPVCERCGRVHDNRIEWNGNPATYCVRCEDEIAVEMHYKNRQIFRDDKGNLLDDEGILDKLATHRTELFTRGILPNYWYTLKEAELCQKKK